MKKKITIEDILEMDKIFSDHYERYRGENSWFISDGIFNLDFYNASKYRILWILKEVNETPDKEDFSDVGDWDYRTDLMPSIRDGNKIEKGWRKTFQPIVYTSFGILNRLYWGGMDDIKDSPEIIDILNHIAFINIKKQPGGAKADPGALWSHYSRDKGIILSQIDLFDPDIITRYYYMR